MRRLLLSLSILFSLLYLGLLLNPNLAIAAHLGSRGAVDISFVPKTASMICLLLFTVAGQGPRKLAAALLFSCVGDFLLGLQRLGTFTPDRLFLYGLLAFLGAHLCYISLFYANRRLEPLTRHRRIAIGAVILALGLMLQMLWPNLGSMWVAVLVYALALDTMAITAIASRYPGTVAIGAISFVASDSLLALDHFSHGSPAFGPLIWVTYYAAQMLIATGVQRASVRARSEKASHWSEAG
jgi:uncharacterized membrane protein YhhN